MKEKIKELKLPEILKMNDGSPVTPEKWVDRRGEILEILQNNMYGRYPEQAKNISVVKVEEHGMISGGLAKDERVTLKLAMPDGDFDYTFALYTPAGVEKPPVIVSIGYKLEGPFFHYPPDEVFKAGIAVAEIPCVDISSDGPDFNDGICPVMFPDGRKGTDAGKIALWGWGCSCVLSYLIDRGGYDTGNACVAGCSRLGKTALCAGLFDERFKFVVSVCSGCSGAAVTRGKGGEHVENITGSFPYWFCDKYATYSNREDELPFDEHFVVAALAPRFVLVNSAVEDAWCDPKAEQLSCYAADETYKMLGLTGFMAEDRDAVVEDFFPDGHIGYSLREGGHGFPPYDWCRIIDFMKAHM